MEGLTSWLGWPFMVASIALISAAWVLPYTMRRLTADFRRYPNLYRMLINDVELRMMVGFILLQGSFAIFALTAFVRSILAEAGAFGDLSLFNRWAVWWVMGPAAVVACLASAMILWDGYSHIRGKWACVYLVLCAGGMWFLGNAIGNFAIELLYGSEVKMLF